MMSLEPLALPNQGQEWNYGKRQEMKYTMYTCIHTSFHLDRRRIQPDNIWKTKVYCKSMVRNVETSIWNNKTMQKSGNVK